uniref:DUF4127 family protein n=1 Tax=Fervidobacterium nodosum TaxID=2424 RepID=A0A7C5Y9F2_9BACT
MKNKTNEKVGVFSYMEKLFFLPVDERFCTKDYFIMLSTSASLKIMTPDKFGMKKIPADVDEIHRWLLSNTQSRDVLIASAEMLIHGGLIPSRIDLLTEKTIEKRLSTLKQIKEKGVIVYLSVTVTRIPNYNSADEEPEYWEYYGKDISEWSKKYSAIISKTYEEEDIQKENLPTNIPKWIIEDFLNRRKRNFKTVQKCIELTKAGVIDYLSITLDDNAPDSLSFHEAQEHQKLVDKLELNDRVSIRNGADEAMITTLGRFLCDYFERKPKFYTIYRFPESKRLIPPYESSALEDSVNNHIRAVGGIVSEHIEQSDIILFVNNFNGSEKTLESPYQNVNESEIQTIKNELEKILDYAKTHNKILSIADIRYANGSDICLMKALLSMQIDWTKVNYYGWNTAGNSIGTCTGHSIIQYLAQNNFITLERDEIERYQATLILEHYGYQAIVRQKLREAGKDKCNILWTTIPCEDWAISYAKANLHDYLQEINTHFRRNWKLEAYFPWHRTFEIGIVLSE